MPEASNSPVAIGRAVEYVQVLVYRATCVQCGKQDVTLQPPYTTRREWDRFRRTNTNRLIDSGWLVIDKRLHCPECAKVVYPARPSSGSGDRFPSSGTST